MRPIHYFLIGSILVIPFVWDFSPPEAAEPHIKAPIDAQFKQGIQNFGLKLDKTLQHEGKNLIFSPWNIATLLGLAGEGAKGDTEAAFWDLLELPKGGSKSEFRDALLKLEQKGDYELSSAVGLWLQSGFLFNPLFQQIAVEDFKGEIGQENFKESPEISRKKINRWIAEATKEKIPELLKNGVIKKETHIVLASLIYMNAPFLSPFSTSLTREDLFTPSNGTPFPIHFLHQTGTYPYFENEAFQLVEIPYRSSPLNVVLWIMLPRTHLEPFDVEHFDPLLKMTEVELKLPKMEVRSSLDLKAPLQALGFKLPFTLAADFTGMTGTPLELSTIVHEAYMSWDEKGTEAAAASAAVFMKTSMPTKDEVVPFHADRPFSFLIWEKETGIPLFQGQVEVPKPWEGRELLPENDHMID